MAFSVEQIRKDFPQLAGGFHYLDSQATSLTPRRVLDKQDEYYREYRANTHRAIFPWAAQATEEYEAAREKIAKWIGASADEVIVTGGATEGSNMLLRMLDETEAFWTSGKTKLVSTVMEHHASLVPLQQLAKRRGMELRCIGIAKEGVGLDMKQAEALITDEVAVVSVMLASNVTGTINDVARIAEWAHRRGAFVIVDATAAIGHVPLDVAELGADAIFFAGHKILGPTGVGILWVKGALLATLEPSAFGGHMISWVEESRSEWAGIPDRFEPGTKNIGGLIALGEAVDYLSEIGTANIHAHVRALTHELIVGLSEIPGVHIIAERDPAKNIGDVSFVCDFAHPHDVAEVLGAEGVGVRPGHHCALPYHTALGVTATTRSSLYLYNTSDDVKALCAGVRKVARLFA